MDTTASTGAMRESESDQWYFTVIRTQGMRLMRPEKSWRPIVTVQVDNLHTYETVLGVDGQNPNLKQAFLLHEAKASSQVSLKVWHKSQSKKKARKRNLVATASHSLGELLKKQQQDPCAKFEIRLTCQSTTKHTTAKGKPQNGATLFLKVQPPFQFPLPHLKNGVIEPTVEEHGYLSNSDVSSSESLPSPRSSSSSPSVRISELVDCQDEDEDEDDATVVPTPTPSHPNLRKRLNPKLKRVWGYAIDSEDEVYSLSTSESADEQNVHTIQCFSDAECDEEEMFTYTEITNVSTPRIQTTRGSSSSGNGWKWFAPSLLPSHTLTPASISTSLPAYSENGTGSSSSSPPSSLSSFFRSILPKFADQLTSEPEHGLKVVNEDGKVEKEKEKEGENGENGENGEEGEKGREANPAISMNIAEKVLSSFTTYESLKRARLDSEYERVFEKLQMEWCYVGGLLVALAAVNTGVFSISGNGVFKIHPYARYAIATSSTFTGLGLACDAWFLFRYHWMPTHILIHRAVDIYTSYFFFSLSSRLPLLSTLTAAVALTTFLVVVAYEAWPVGVLVTFFGWGVMMTLQFLVFGVHWVVRGVGRVGRELGRAVRRVVGWLGGLVRGRRGTGVGGRE